MKKELTFMSCEETNTIELKEQYTDTFLKTVSAFANESGGKIIFGVTDSGKVVGIKDFKSLYPKIERKIFDMISPIPYFDIEIDHVKKTICINVDEGDEKPYFYKQKAYIRRNTSTILADSAFQKRMILETKGITFEEMPVKNAFLTFDYLEAQAKNSIGVQKISDDFLKTSGLIGKDGNFNKAAVLFSDENDMPGIDTVKYDEKSEKFTLRNNFSKCSILEQLHKVMEVFDYAYSFEKINGIKREKHYEVPIKAFREALVNAIIHRDWNVKANIKITFFDNRVEILSPGTLPKDISKNEFLNRYISAPRNYIICSMFRKLGYIERMGYGISMIKNAYRNHTIKPRFEFLDNFINVILPVSEINIELNQDEAQILETLKYAKALSSSDISLCTKISRTKVVAICNLLCSKNLVEKNGTGRATKYSLPT